MVRTTKPGQVKRRTEEPGEGDRRTKKTNGEQGAAMGRDPQDKLEAINLNNLPESSELTKSFTNKNGTLQVNLDKVIFTSDEFCKRKIPKPPTLVWPWLTEKSVNMIYGFRGAGKTWLGLILAVNLTRKNDGELPDIGPWKIRHSASTLYVDAEMGNFLLQDRLNELCKGLPPEDPENPLHILTGDDYAHEHGKQLNLSEQIREAIREKLKQNPSIKVLILDNASALTPGIDENDKKSWDVYNQWMISLKNMGMAVIMVHHRGKSKDVGSRGHSSREDPMDYIIEVRKHKEHKDGDYAWFTVISTKSRNLRPGEPKHNFSLRMVPHPDGGLTWEEDNEGTDNEKMRQIKEDILMGQMKQKEIAEEFGITPGRVSQIKTELLGEGYLKPVKRKGKIVLDLTQKGEDFLE